MSWRRLTYCEDLMRPTRAFSWGFLDLIEEPVFQGSGHRIGNPVGRPPCPGMTGTFSLERFHELAGGSPDQKRWVANYQRIPLAAEHYLASHMRPDALFVAFELPPWLAATCATAGVRWLDLRVSPLRFARDLYLAIRTNDSDIAARLEAFDVPEDELRLEASLLKASVRMHQARLEEAGRHSFALGKALIFFGQAPYDASLVADDGTSISIGDFAVKIRDLAEGRRVFYKPHPFAEWHAGDEIARLGAIVDRGVDACRQNAYQILASREDIELIGLSSGVLQEARYFSKPAHILFRPHVPIAADDALGRRSGFMQVRFRDALSPAFWHQLLAPDHAPPRVPALPPLQPNHARELLDQWWDYSKCLTWERSLWIEGYTRSGGGLLRDRVGVLEEAIRVLRASA